MSTLDKSRKVNKTNRIPVGGNRDILTVTGKDEEFEYRIVNDSPGRIQKFEAAGYEVVTGEDIIFGQNRVSSTSSKSSVAETPVGQGTTGVLMKVKRDWYEEDQSAKQEVVDRKEESISQGTGGDYGNVSIK